MLEARRSSRSSSVILTVCCANTYTCGLSSPVLYEPWTQRAKRPRRGCSDPGWLQTCAPLSAPGPSPSGPVHGPAQRLARDPHRGTLESHTERAVAVNQPRGSPATQAVSPQYTCLPVVTSRGQAGDSSVNNAITSEWGSASEREGRRATRGVRCAAPVDSVRVKVREEVSNAVRGRVLALTAWRKGNERLSFSVQK